MTQTVFAPTEQYKWAHEDRLTLVGEVVLVGATVSIPALGIDAAEVMAVLPPNVEGGVTRFRVRWYEAAAKDSREANFWREDVMLVAGQQKAANP